MPASQNIGQPASWQASKPAYQPSCQLRNQVAQQPRAFALQARQLFSSILFLDIRLGYHAARGQDFMLPDGSIRLTPVSLVPAKKEVVLLVHGAIELETVAPLV
jgi:hypothetical protein